MGEAIPPQTDRAGPLSIVVAATTRNRPAMLRDLLRSLGAIELPSDVEVALLVVENNDTPAMVPVIDAVRPEIAWPLHYAQEPQIGISMARNRALDEALDLHADLLVFVDDDEEVERDWLGKLSDHYRATEAALIGGPARPKRPDLPLTRWQDVVFGTLAETAREKEGRWQAFFDSGQFDLMPLATNNWLVELATVTRLGLRFDPALRYSGGEDSKFFRDARAQNVPIGWVPDAIVHETIPPERLTLGYQYARARDQSSTMLQARLRRRGRLRETMSVLNAVTRRSLGLVARLAGLPLSGTRGLVPLFSDAGWIVGRIRGLMQIPSDHYRKTTGY